MRVRAQFLRGKARMGANANSSRTGMNLRAKHRKPADAVLVQ